jgi:hypothetical protein
MKDGRATPLKTGAPREVERRARIMRKRRDAAAVLTILGVVLFTSPLISAIGAADSREAVPLAVQYVFDVWAILIAAAFILARVLPGQEDTHASQGLDATDHSAPSTNARARKTPSP